MCAPCHCMAQDVWERPTQETATTTITTPNPDAKYLAGAVPEIDGKVCWTLDTYVKGKSAQQIYDNIYAYISSLAKEENQLEGSGISLINKKDHIIAATMKEWMVFKSQLLVLDRTQFHYTIIAKCYDGHLNVTISRLSYKYDEDRDRCDELIKAEEIITDKMSLKKKGTKMIKKTAKFRRMTVDRVSTLIKAMKRAAAK